eukprot:TRINITY_DN4997_c0_g1_i1.p1 TRINITY_DN4997_c0_g1~~TRINITY_DN4997_c0_g1_i1.p1  ORF type:complete len:107 (+),score=37.37 TRINITY_DN4997_c0_g1_i1:43-363(+)
MEFDNVVVRLVIEDDEGATMQEREVAAKYISRRKQIIFEMPSFESQLELCVLVSFDGQQFLDTGHKIQVFDVKCLNLQPSSTFSICGGDIELECTGIMKHDPQDLV